MVWFKPPLRLPWLTCQFSIRALCWGLNFRNSPLERRTMFSRKVFCGATSPLLPPCILRVLGRNSELLGGLDEDHSPSRQSACSERIQSNQQCLYNEIIRSVNKIRACLLKGFTRCMWGGNAFYLVSSNQIRLIEEIIWIFFPTKWVTSEALSV